jgi:hypothetical protein
MDFREGLAVAKRAGDLCDSVSRKLDAGEGESALREALRAVGMHATDRTFKTLAVAAMANKHYGLAVELWKKIKTMEESGGAPGRA